MANLFISFTRVHAGGQNFGFGNIVVEERSAPSTLAEVKELTAHIERQAGAQDGSWSYVISGWQEMREPEPTFSVELWEGTAPA